MKKFLLILLALSMVLPSCAQTNVVETEESKSSESIAEPNESIIETEDEFMPGVPDDLSFGGKTFRIMCNDYLEPGWTQLDIDSEGMNGTPVNDAVFVRNATIENKYDCEITEQKTLTLHNDLRILVQAADSSVDIATPFFWCGTLADMVVQGNFINLKTVDTMDLSAPWYDQNSVSDFEILDKLYFLTSDLTIGDLIATAGMVFNKQLYEDYQCQVSYGNIYNLVREGKWTLDKLQDMVLTLSTDKNGDGEMTQADFFGMIYQRDSVQSFFNASGMRTASINSEGIPEFTLVTEANANKLDEIFGFLYTKENCFNVMNEYVGDNFTNGMTKMFMSNQALFMWIRFADVEILRSMDIDFGIIPVPKWDEEQSRYYSTVNNYMGTATVIPISCEDPELEGYFLEVLCCESKKELIPAYYDVTLQGKVARDVESTDMLDIIFDNRIYDIGDIFNFGGFAGTLYNMTMSYNSAYSSTWASGQRRYSKAIDTYMKKFEKLEY